MMEKSVQISFFDSLLQICLTFCCLLLTFFFPLFPYNKNQFTVKRHTKTEMQKAKKTEKGSTMSVGVCTFVLIFFYIVLGNFIFIVCMCIDLNTNR